MMIPGVDGIFLQRDLLIYILLYSKQLETGAIASYSSTHNEC